MTDSELARIVVIKTFDPDSPGGIAITTEYPTDLTLADALGMLAYALHTTIETFNDND